MRDLEKFEPNIGDKENTENIEDVCGEEELGVENEEKIKEMTEKKELESKGELEKARKEIEEVYEKLEEQKKWEEEEKINLDFLDELDIEDLEKIFSKGYLIGFLTKMSGSDNSVVRLIGDEGNKILYRWLLKRLRKREKKASGGQETIKKELVSREKDQPTSL